VKIWLYYFFDILGKDELNTYIGFNALFSLLFLFYSFFNFIILFSS